MLGSGLSPFTGHDPSVNMRKSHMRKILLLSASLLALTCTVAAELRATKAELHRLQ
jgi:hypothetical protein